MHVELAFGLLCASGLISQTPTKPAAQPAVTRTAPSRMTPLPQPKAAPATPPAATPSPAATTNPIPTSVVPPTEGTASATAEKKVIDRAQLRTEVEKALKDLSSIADKDLSATQKSLKELWAKRIELLDDWDKTVRSRDAARRPSPTPEREANDRKAELERVKASLEQLKSSPDSAYVDAFITPEIELTETKLAEMQEILNATKTTLKERAAELEKLRAEPAARTELLSTLRVAREKLHAQKTGDGTRRAEAESKLFKAPNEDARKIAREEFVNLRCEMGLTEDRLALTEACIDLETRRVPTCEVATQAAQSNVQLATQTLDALSKRYTYLAERMRSDLNFRAQMEARRAETLEDPIEKFKALRKVELLTIQALILEAEKTLSTNTTLTPEEQTILADRAQEDFEKLKRNVKENKVGGVLALRFNNDFRRISRERTTILRNELVSSAAANTFYENALTEAELACLNDAREDKFERDALIQSLPFDRRSDVKTLVIELEKKHNEALDKHRDILAKLLKRAESIHDQVNRRLKILDDHYSFIRANIFWVRDSEPLGPGTLPAARKEAARLFIAARDMAADPLDGKRWSNSGAEFYVALCGLIILPWPIMHIRKTIKPLCG